MMVSNDIFRKFLEDPNLKEKAGLTDDEIKRLSLSSQTTHSLIEIIKTTLLAMSQDENYTVEKVARRINKAFNQDLI